MQLLAEQLGLQREAYGQNPPSLQGEDLAEYLRDNVLALEDEAHELLREAPGWKPWSRRECSIPNRERYAGEVADLLHFVANLALVIGMDDEELEARYLEKNALNAQRQEEGYRG